jgi:hypothetical protein
VDALASGKALVIPRHGGVARLERQDVPVVFYEGASRLWTRRCPDLSSKVMALLTDDGRRRELGRRALLFARERMDIYLILERLLGEAML